MLASETVAKDVSLVKELKKTIQNITSLARVSEDDTELSTPPDPVASAEATGLPDISPAGEASEATISLGPPAEMNDLTSGTNVFGNGWFGRVATSFTDAQHLRLPPSSAFPFAAQLVQTTLQIAYRELAEAPPPPLFAYSLRHHDRAELLFNIRWFLGPGSAEVHRLGGVSFATSASAAVFAEARGRIGDLSLAVDVDAVQDLVERTEALALEEPFLNANTVEMYLRQKGIRYLDAGQAAETRASGTSDPLGDAARGLAEASVPPSSTSAPRNLFSFDAFFPEREPVAALSKHLLLRNLADISVCLASGPGYRRTHLDQAIAASVVQVRG
jgi:hypothetical protein